MLALVGPKPVDEVVDSQMILGFVMEHLDLKVGYDHSLGDSRGRVVVGDGAVQYLGIIDSIYPKYTAIVIAESEIRELKDEIRKRRAFMQSRIDEMSAIRDELRWATEEA